MKIINGYQKGEVRILRGYRFFNGTIATEGAARMYNNACERAHSSGYDEPSLNEKWLAFQVASRKRGSH